MPLRAWQLTRHRPHCRCRSNEPEFLEAQLTWPQWMRAVYGKPEWHFDKRPPTTAQLVFMRLAHEPKKIVTELVTLGFEYAHGAVRAALRALGCAAGRHGRIGPAASSSTEGKAAGPVAESTTEDAEARPAEQGGSHRSGASASGGGSSASSSGGAGSVLREGRALARSRLKTRSAALLFVYAAWGIMVGLIFVYGRLIYSLDGAKSEASFVSSWAIALGIENASGTRATAA